MEKNLPKRAASRKIFIFWQLVAFFMQFYGIGLLIDGEGIGIIPLLGGFGMCLREMNFRMKWKKQQKEALTALGADRKE